MIPNVNTTHTLCMTNVYTITQSTRNLGQVIDSPELVKIIPIKTNINNIF